MLPPRLPGRECAVAPLPSDVEALARRHVAAWNAHNGDEVATTYTPDARFSINDGEPMVGRAQIAEMVRGFAAEFPDLTLTLDGVHTAGENAVYLWTFEGTHRYSGNRVKFGGWECWRLNDDVQVVSSLGYYDEAEYKRQLVEGI